MPDQASPVRLWKRSSADEPSVRKLRSSLIISAGRRKQKKLRPSTA